MILPASLHEKFIKRGAILHSEIFEDIDHGKFFAVVGVSDDMVAGFFFINSRINPIIMSRPEQLAMQYPLKHKDYSFLKAPFLKFSHCWGRLHGADSAS